MNRNLDELLSSCSCELRRPRITKMTNADRIRNMDNEELLDFLCSIQTYDEGATKTIENGVAMCSVSDVEKWLESESD